MVKNFMVLVLCIAIAFLSACSKSPSLNGKVTNTQGEPLDGVSISINNSRFSTVSSEEGTYKLPYTPGKFEVNFTRPGYKEQKLVLEISNETQFPVSDVVLSGLNNTPEALAKSVFDTLVNNDKAEYSKWVFPTIDLLVSLREEPENEKVKKMLRVLTAPKEYEKYKAMSIDAWSEVRNSLSKRRNMNWRQAVLSRAEYKTEFNDFEFANIELFMKANNRSHVIKIDAVKLGEQWFPMEGLRL